MKISLSKHTAKDVKADVVAVGVRKKELGKTPAVKALDSALGGAIKAAAKDEDFSGGRGQVLKVPAVKGVGAKWVFLVGLGDAEGAAAAADLGVYAARALKLQKSIAFVLSETTEETVKAVAQGAVTGAYRYDKYFTGDRKPKGELKSVSILVDASTPELRDAATEGQAIGESVNVARTLVNDPPNDMNPITLANFAKEEGAALGLKCTIWDKKRIEKENMRLFLAVNQGGSTEPRLIHLVHKPKNATKETKKVVFVGKGLTFDAGGLCLKPAKSMIDMKCDMAGAAATIGILFAAARLDVPVEVHGIIGATENMTGDQAYRPGDIIESRDGKMVEIINTDAEGRLVLADVLSYARELEPDFMIDHATLTGACMVALGQWTAGFYSNDVELADLYTEAAADAGESFWHMPLDKDIGETLRSPIADMKHTGAPFGGSISAACFLQEFVGETKWAHCDIAGPAFLDSPHRRMPKGGTGFGVQTGISFLKTL